MLVPMTKADDLDQQNRNSPPGVATNAVSNGNYLVLTAMFYFARFVLCLLLFLCPITLLGLRIELKLVDFNGS